MNTTTTKRFTLIELLVVVAIIGILAGIIITSLSNAREKARDARRDAGIKTIQTALEIYYLDHGEYPGSEWHRSNSNWSNLETLMGITLPEDPVNEGGYPHSNPPSFTYAYHPSSPRCPTNQAYRLLYRHESGDTPLSESPGVTRCDTGNQWKGGQGSITVGVSPAG